MPGNSRLLGAVVAVLALVVIAQQLQLWRLERAMDGLHPSLEGEAGAVDAIASSGSTGERRESGESAEATPPPTSRVEPISEYTDWIDAAVSDERPWGYSAYLVLRPGGRMLLERCDAPDYAGLEVDAESDPHVVPGCRMILDGYARAIGEGEIAYTPRGGDAIALAYTLDGARLGLVIEGEAIALEPGQKNALFEALTALPSVVAAREAAWQEHVRLRQEMEQRASAPPPGA